MIAYFTQRRMERYQHREIRSRIHALRSDYVAIIVRLWDWRMERSPRHPPRAGDWNLDITLSEMIDEFGLNASRLVRMCDIWFLQRGFDDGRQKFGMSVGLYLRDRTKLIDAWSISSESKPRSALVEAVVTELLPYPEFASLDHHTAYHRKSK
jgi:hypothetical protein